MTPQSIYRLVTDRRTDGIKHHNISAVHCVHLADITSITVYEKMGLFDKIDNSVIVTMCKHFHANSVDVLV